MNDWAGRGFSGLTRVAGRNVLPGLPERKRVRKVQIPRLPLWGEAQPATALVLWPGETHAAVHFYGPDGGYLHTSVMRSGGIMMMWEGARYWRAEPIPQTFDEVLAGRR